MGLSRVSRFSLLLAWNLGEPPKGLSLKTKYTPTFNLIHLRETPAGQRSNVTFLPQKTQKRDSHFFKGKKKCKSCFGGFRMGEVENIFPGFCGKHGEF